MKVPVSYFESSLPFPDDALAEIEKHLKGDAANFIKRAQIEAATYRELAKAWDSAPPATLREQIEIIGRLSQDIAAALTTLPPAARQLLDQAGELERKRYDDGVLIELQRRLEGLSAVCARAARFKDLNKGQGSTGDAARRSLIARCAEAYMEATGKSPSTSSSGTFAKAMRAVLRAAGAPDGLSNDLLRSLIHVR